MKDVGRRLLLKLKQITSYLRKKANLVMRMNGTQSAVRVSYPSQEAYPKDSLLKVT